MRRSTWKVVLILAGLIGAASLPVEMAAVQVGHEVAFAAASPHPYPPAAGKTPAWTIHIEHAGATYLAIHFERFELAPGDRIVVRSPDGYQRHVFTGRGKGGRGTFWGTHIKGDRAVVELFAAPGGAEGWGVSIDRYAAGFLDMRAKPGTPGSIESICGQDNKVNAVCAVGVEDEIYQHSRGVARLLINGTGYCTGWLVGCQGHLLTNEHCISSQNDAVNTDYEFLAEAPTCGASSCQGCDAGEVWPGGASLVRGNSILDYAFIRLNGDPQLRYGSFLLADRAAVVGESIYIPQHPGGRGKEIGRLSTAPQDPAGTCTVFSTDETPCSGGPGDVGYFCDTEGGSSGSPVVSYDSHKVIALHHCAACANRGVPIDAIIQDLDAFLPACALQDGPLLRQLDHLADDVLGNGDGVVDPGEGVRLSVTVGNLGTDGATGITGFLSTSEPGVTIVDDAASWPDLDPGASAPSDAPGFAFGVAPSVPCGTVLDFELALDSDQGSWVETLQQLVGIDLTTSQIFVSNETPLDIPDDRARGVVSTLDVPTDIIPILGDVQVGVEVRHTFIGDLQMALVSPQGTPVVLHNRSGGDSDDIVTFYDQLTPTDGPGAMSDFDGEDAGGVWRLGIRDVATLDSGRLVRWGLVLSGPSTFQCSSEADLSLSGPSPGIAGASNTMVAGGATPGSTVVFLSGAAPGSTEVTGCPGIRVGIGSPTIIGETLADPGGNAALTVSAPAAASGLTVRFQAVDTGACRVSERVLYTFP